MALGMEDITVSVASKRDEKARRAPAVLSVVTAEDIARYGGNNLHDVLRRVPSLLAISRNIIPNSFVSIRGTGTAEISNHVLFLLNGRPVRESASGGNLVAWLTSLPLSAIEKLEIIRGPGSVLYGTNAFGGVINIITRQLQRAEGSVSATYGSYNSRQLELAGGGATSGATAFTAAKAGRNDGFANRYRNAVGTPMLSHMTEDTDAALATLNYKGLTLEGFSGQAQSITHSQNGMPYPLDNDERFFDIGYRLDLPSQWAAQLNGTYNQHQLDFAPTYFSAQAHDRLAELSLQGPLSDSLRLLFGGVYDHRQGNFYSSRVTYTAVNRSLYSQFDYQPLTWLTLIAGGQYNKAGSLAGDFSPRLGATVDLDANWSAKLLYSRAYRTAYASQRNVRIPGQAIGNPNLRPETVATTDLQLSRTDANTDLALTLYHSRQNDTITIQSPNYVNGSGITYSGLELEGKYRPLSLPGLELQSSLLYQYNATSTGYSYTTLTPRVLGKIGVSYAFDNAATLGVFDEYSSLPGTIPTTNQALNGKPRPYNWLTANFDINLTDALNLAQWPESHFGLYGENLLNEKTIQAQPQITFQDEGGRAFYARYSVKF